MRTAKIGDTVVKLNERDYKQLLKRFDTSTIVTKGVFLRTNGHCLCQWYDRTETRSACQGCPLLYGRRTAGCIDLLEKMVGEWVLATPSTNGMMWYKLSDAKARTQLNTIHSFLLRIPRTQR